MLVLTSNLSLTNTNEMFDDGEHACQNDTNIIIHFFGSLCSLFPVTSIKVTEKVYTRAAVKETFNHRLLVILSEVNGTSFLLWDRYGKE